MLGSKADENHLPFAHRNIHHCCFIIEMLTSQKPPAHQRISVGIGYHYLSFCLLSGGGKSEGGAAPEENR